VERNGSGLQSEDALTPAESAREALVMGLRLREGVDLPRVARRTGQSQDALIDGIAVARLEALGLLTQSRERLTVTDAGMPLLDRILAEIVTT
jgi:coproporphyrinogen III oxidase-like Fe-S oxidoreductase